MRVPISYALTYPERAATPLPPLDLTALTLEFHAPDLETFPMLALAREAGESGGVHPCVFNAANEVAVAAFLAGRLPFLGIPELVADALARVDGRAGARPRRSARGRRARRGGSRREGFRSHDLARRRRRPRPARVHPRARPLHHGARASGIRPRSFYIGFPPAIVKFRRNGIEYGIGAIPLGGMVRIPGMNRLAGQDVDVVHGARA